MRRESRILWLSVISCFLNPLEGGAGKFPPGSEAHDISATVMRKNIDNNSVVICSDFIYHPAMLNKFNMTGDNTIMNTAGKMNSTRGRSILTAACWAIISARCD